MHQRSPRLDPRLLDGLVVAAVAAPALLGLVVPTVFGDANLADIPPTAVVLAAGQALALWWRRRHPVTALAATLAVLLAAQALGDVNAASYLGPHAAAYAVGAYGTRRAVIGGLAGAGAVALVEGAVTRWVETAQPYGPVLLGPSGVLVAVAWGVGRYVRVRRDYLTTLVAYAHQLEADRDKQAHQAVVTERRRIARELHDQVAHHLGVAALQTGAAQRWLSRDTDRARSAMASVEQAVRAALTTMPVILEALRADDASVKLAPQPTLADVEELVARVTDAGLPVQLRVTGDRRPLNPAVELTAYRIVQEALTNTMKHAGPARSTVELRYLPDRLEVEVTDDGYGAAAKAGEGARLGLVGMRERVDLLGGGLTTVVAEGGGFTVRASLPATAEVRQ